MEQVIVNNEACNLKALSSLNEGGTGHKNTE